MKNSTNINITSAPSNNSRINFKFKAIIFILASILFGFGGAFAQATPGVSVDIASPYQIGSSDEAVVHIFCFSNTSVTMSDRINITGISNNNWVVALFDSANDNLMGFDANGDGNWDYVDADYDADLNGQPDTRLLSPGAQVCLNVRIYIPNGATVGKIDTLSMIGFSIADYRISDKALAFTEVKAPSSLPIQLLSFTAGLNGKVVNLNWTTATEINNDFFSIERSSNGKDFKEILVMRGAGNSNSLSGYTITDTEPLTGVAYYRLKQTDYDGQSKTFSPVIVNNKSVNVTASNISIQQPVYPNPFMESFNLGFNVLTAGNVTATITNIQGKVISTELVNTSKGYNTFTYEGSNLPKGMYFISLESNGSVIVSKISKISGM